MSAQASPNPAGTPPPTNRWERFFKVLPIGAAFLAGLAALGGTAYTSYYGLRTARAAEQGLVTERFKDGVGELGSSDENVQAGGMFTLARVAQDSPGDADTAYYVILSFVRGHLCQNTVLKESVVPGPPQSVIAGLMVLHHARRRIDLTSLKCDVSADLSNVDLSGAYLNYARLSGASLEGANLEGAHLNSANLDHTDFTHRAVLTGADFTCADVSSTGFRGSVGLTRDQLRRIGWSSRPHVDDSEKGWITPSDPSCSP
jgi:Pentapeptide repeats (8 copies)